MKTKLEKRLARELDSLLARHKKLNKRHNDLEEAHTALHKEMHWLCIKCMLVVILSNIITAMIVRHIHG